jgi:hypothetical protein
MQTKVVSDNPDSTAKEKEDVEEENDEKVK